MNDLSWSPPSGHNNPPLDLAASLTSAAISLLLADKFSTHRERCAELLAADARFAEATKDGIGNDDVAAKATDFVRQLKAAGKATDDCRAEIKAPVLAAQRQIDGEAKLIMDPLATATARAETRIKVYLRQKEAEARARAVEEARLQEQEAMRLAAEAEALTAQTATTPAEADALDAAEVIATEKAVAAIDAAQDAAAAARAPAADLSRTRTALGGVASLRQNWTYEITDKLALLRAIIAGDASADYVSVNDQMLKALAKSQKDKAKVPGINFFNDVGINIR